MEKHLPNPKLNVFPIEEVSKIGIKIWNTINY